MSGAGRTLEIVWQQDATAWVFARAGDGMLSAEGLHVGVFGSGELASAGRIDVRRVPVRDIVVLAADPPAGDRASVGARGRSSRSSSSRTARVAEGLVHPYLDHGDGGWHAFWGATLDRACRRRSPRSQRRCRRSRPTRSTATATATVHDLYPGRRRPDRARPAARRRACSLRPPMLPRSPVGARAVPRRAHRGRLAAAAATPATRRCERQLSRLGRTTGSARSRAVRSAWRIGLHLDERGRGGRSSCSSCGCRPRTTRRSACRRRSCGRATTTSSPSCATSDPRRDFDPPARGARAAPRRARRSSSTARSRPRRRSTSTPSAVFLREAMPLLEERGVPVLLPAALGALARPAAVNLTATSRRDPTVRSSGLLSPAELLQLRLAARRRRRVAHRGGARASSRRRRSPFVRVAGTLACAAPLRGRAGASVPRAPPRRLRDRRARPRGLGPRDRRGGARARRGHARRAARASSSSDDDAALPLAADAAVDGSSQLFGFQERGHGWLRMLGDLGVGAILADDMGLGKTVQAIAMLASEREELGPEALGPTLVVCPMSVVKQWVARDRALRAVAARALASRPRPSRRRRRSSRRAHVPTSSSRPTTSRRATSRRSRSSSGTGCCSTRRRTSRTPRRSARARCAGCARGGGSR